MQAMNHAAGILHRNMMSMVRSCQMPKLPTTSPMMSLTGSWEAGGTGLAWTALRLPSGWCKWQTLRCESCGLGMGEWPPPWTGDAWLTISSRRLAVHSGKQLRFFVSCCAWHDSVFFIYLRYLCINIYIGKTHLSNPFLSALLPPPPSLSNQWHSIKINWKRLKLKSVEFRWRWRRLWVSSENVFFLLNSCGSNLSQKKLCCGRKKLFSMLWICYVQTKIFQWQQGFFIPRFPVRTL